MKLHIAGINHFDPAGRPALRAWLDGLAQAHSDLPAFIGIEWDPDQFAAVRAQRSEFRQLASTQWPDASPALREALELSVGYEGDTHAAVFPTVATLWLDQGLREDRWEKVSTYARDRLHIYNSYIGGEGLSADVRSALRMLGRVAWQRADECNPPIQGSDRDDQWTARVCHAIRQARTEWAIVIVGKNHASGNDRYLRCQLEDRGYACEVTYLRPE